MDRTEPIIVEITTYSTAVKAWAAVTELDEMIQWYFDNIPEFKAEVGFETEFPVHSEERTFTHQWKVTDVQVGRSITYDWSYPEYPGMGEVTFEIEDLGETRTVRVINKGLDSFPDDIPEFTRESCTGGWNYFMGRLKNYLEQ